ncbi:TetR/AcrR family transcriptional regulator [Agrococcus baldri]|uniref:TetR family transcriptional regulator n=1 Tax=Agrococcus baldri TaxID=153730 RepID=A0AA87RAI0_9MICO|nr:TetR/AcrR family transcriptional regulator [Agrococcus baldri]GEK79102.1 TetR family transcriptional regulator [Agrococcus baldri]
MNVVATPRGAILESATRLFGTNGYAGTTMRHIATAVGVLPGSLYAHIQSKEELLSEIVETGIDRFLALGHEVLASPASAEDHMYSLITGHVQLVAVNTDSIRVVYHQWRHLSGEARARVVEKRREYEAMLLSVIDDGIEKGEFVGEAHPNVSAKAILGALNWTSEWIRPDGPETSEEIGRQMADTLIGGLKSGRGSLSS